MRRVLFLFVSLFMLTSAAAQTCYEGVGVNDSHSWIFRDNPDMQTGDLLRAYAPDGECVGQVEWTKGQSNSLAVKGQVDAVERLIDAGDPITFRVVRRTASDTVTTRLSSGSFVFEDTDLGPSPSTYTINGISVVSDFDVQFTGEITQYDVPLDLPTDVVVLDESEDSTIVYLDWDMPYADTLRAYQIRIVGSSNVRIIDTDGYSRVVETDSGRIHQSLGVAYPGGQVLGEVEDLSPEVWFPAPAVGDTLSVSFYDGTVVGDRTGVPYVVTYPNGHTVRWTRSLRYDLNNDGVRDMNDVIVALDDVLVAEDKQRALQRALDAYRAVRYGI